jgi:hypothetical protein
MYTFSWFAPIPTAYGNMKKNYGGSGKGGGRREKYERARAVRQVLKKLQGDKKRKEAKKLLGIREGRREERKIREGEGSDGKTPARKIFNKLQLIREGREKSRRGS